MVRRTVKRARRTKVEVEELRGALREIVEENMPVTVRGVFYLAASAGLVPKDDTKGYRPVQRELLKMRREGVIRFRFTPGSSRLRRALSSGAYCAGSFSTSDAR